MRSSQPPPNQRITIYQAPQKEKKLISTSPPAKVGSMDSAEWDKIKSKFQLGQIIQGQVEFHASNSEFKRVTDDTDKGLSYGWS